MIPAEIAPEVYRLNIGGFVNAYLIGNARGWVLVDTGVAGQFEAIKDAVEQKMGIGARPNALILTHGHGDHVGSALALATYWDIPIYAHRMELPYLTGKSAYPPADPTTGGPFAFIMRFAPQMMRGTDLGDTVQPLPDDGTVPGLGSEWRYIPTPGHAPGHISLFREHDKVLIAGDAVVTINVDSFKELLKPRSRIVGPPAPVTPDWYAARKSIEALAALQPKLVAPGHGEPVIGAIATVAMNKLAGGFRVPEVGRYVPEAAQFDALGVRYLPPAPRDSLPVVAGVTIATLAIGWAVWTAKQRAETQNRRSPGNIED